MARISIPECDVRPFDMGPLSRGPSDRAVKGACLGVAALAAAGALAAGHLSAPGAPAPVAVAVLERVAAPAEDVVRLDAALFSEARFLSPPAPTPPRQAATATVPLPPVRISSTQVPLQAVPAVPHDRTQFRVGDGGALPAMFRTPALPASVLGYAPQPTYVARGAVPASQQVPEATAGGPGFLDGLFGALRSLFSPSPDAGATAGRGGQDGYTAFYDISAHTVYMPDGTRLEAHSGLGPMFDDPRYVHARNKGATPPHLYDLTLRETAFHGVQAIRLNPVGPGNVYGRDGLLAHTYMLGRKGESNGCVSFKDYKPFLAAFRNGRIRRLAVVERMAS